MNRRVWAFILGVGTAAVAAVCLLAAIGTHAGASDITSILFLVALGLAADLLAYKLPRQADASVAFIPFVAAALIAPTWTTAVAVAVTKLLAEVIRKKSPVKACFNSLQSLLAVSAAILAFQLLGGVALPTFATASILESSRTDLIPFALAVTVFFALNTLAVSGVVAASEQRPVLQVWKQNTLSTVGYDALSGPIIYLFAWAFVQWGVLGAAGLALPLLGVRQLYSTNLQLEQVNQDLLELMIRAVEARDPYTSGHSRRVQRYSMIIARAVGLTGRQVERIGMAALLHDVGKIHEMYAPILRKPDKLSQEERAVMRTHSAKSAELVSTVSNLKDLVVPVRHHHENWDGSGYPDGLSGEAIPLASRIIMFADTIDAMTSDRPYRKALSEAQVRAELIKFRGRQFDPSICDQLLASPMFSALFTPTPIDATPTGNRRPSPARPVRAVVGG